MSSFLDLNLNINLCMCNISIPSWLFSNFTFPDYGIFSALKMPSFDINTGSQNLCTPSLSNTSVYDYASSKPEKSGSTAISSNISTNADTFVKSKNNEIREENNEVKEDKPVLDDYNSTKGKKLADTAYRRRSRKGFTGQCATYVKNAIVAAGLGSYIKGNAYEMTSILSENPNFKEISPDNINLQDLPEGCILVYDRGTPGYSKKYGHTEITIKDKKTGKVKAVSDGTTYNLHRRPTAIFIPV